MNQNWQCSRIIPDVYLNFSLYFSSLIMPVMCTKSNMCFMYVCIHQFSSVTQSCLTLCNSIDRSTAGLSVHHQLPELAQLISTELVMPSNHLILCHPLLLLPSIFTSIRVFSNESVLRIRWPKYWSFSTSISPSNGYSGLISFRVDWLDLLAVQRTLESSPTPQFKSVNSALSFLYSPTLTSINDHGKNHSLDKMDLCWQSNVSAF